MFVEFDSEMEILKDILMVARNVMRELLPNNQEVSIMHAKYDKLLNSKDNRNFKIIDVEVLLNSNAIVIIFHNLKTLQTVLLLVIPSFAFKRTIDLSCMIKLCSSHGAKVFAPYNCAQITLTSAPCDKN